MPRLVLSIALASSLATSVFAAEPIGVPACDEFLTQYEACIAGNVPAAQQEAFKGQLEQLCANWATLASNPQTKPTLEVACMTSADQMKAAVSSFGCEF